MILRWFRNCGIWSDLCIHSTYLYVRVARFKMKKYWFILIVLSMLPLSNYASTVKHYGVKIGLTSANQEFTGIYLENVDLKRKNGFNAGIFIEFLDFSNFSILTQLEYTQKGMIEENIVTDELGNQIGQYTIESTLNYLSVPISAKYSIPIQNIIPYLIAGLRYDYLINYNSFYEEPPQIGSESSSGFLDNTIYDEFRKSVFGAQFGVGVEIDFISIIKPSIEFRYNIDLTNSLKLEGKTAKNNSFDISLFLPIN